MGWIIFNYVSFLLALAEWSSKCPAPHSRAPARFVTLMVAHLMTWWMGAAARACQRLCNWDGAARNAKPGKTWAPFSLSLVLCLLETHSLSLCFRGSGSSHSDHRAWGIYQILAARLSMHLELVWDPWNLKPRIIQVQIQMLLVLSSLHALSASALRLYVLQYWVRKDWWFLLSLVFSKERTKALGWENGVVENMSCTSFPALPDSAGTQPDMKATLMYVLRYLK